MCARHHIFGLLHSFSSAKRLKGVARTQFVRCRKTISTRSKIVIESSLYRFSKVYLLPSYNKASVRPFEATTRFRLLFFSLIEFGQNRHISTHTKTWLDQPTDPPNLLLNVPSPFSHLPRKSFQYMQQKRHNKTILFRFGFSLVSSYFVLSFFSFSLTLVPIALYCYTKFHLIQLKTVKKLFDVRFCCYSQFNSVFFSLKYHYKMIFGSYYNIKRVRMFLCLHLRMMESKRVRTKIWKGAKMF